jgi:transcriptional regulator with XRE-family HTH domain
MERKATYIRAWRKHRGFTIDQLVGRLAELSVDTTGASISRIERGAQPYSQDILEAIAAALDVAVADLIENNPDVPDAEVIDIWRHLDDGEKRQAEAVLRAMFEKRA